MRKRKVYLEDQLDSMIDLLYRARRLCHYQARLAGSVSVDDLLPGKFLQPDLF